MQIALESPDQPEIIALIAELDAYQHTLYPPESVYALDLSALVQPHVRFAVARNGQGDAVGCGALAITPDFAELKRMYVMPAHRGQGVASRLLRLLEDDGRASGCAVITLETGIYQPEAIGLYTRHGYQRRGPYGDYPDDPFSVFMEKRLVATAAAPQAGGCNEQAA
jgi:putative acetyltransferase